MSGTPIIFNPNKLSETIIIALNSHPPQQQNDVSPQQRKMPMQKAVDDKNPLMLELRHFGSD
eukprot:CAMPEP_0202978778 /NCGR_PEP_ID=MMETSP1396-20130829/85094_1 /ASSEMBLY_ACC=CAM_ASM_000872 /TAXON_ID= /ORGANISM="Pseudokeronopsis sp., Strain Brazil" /LENGTH=61 /DNA_ID=CAMNT_0049717885 /DNA_START=1896 /DNA_END=2081 /DNA_ORIENTATION=-